MRISDWSSDVCSSDLALRQAWPQAEIIVVNDGSTDATATIAASHGAQVVSNPYSMGNGAAIKRGARAASGDILVFMDARSEERRVGKSVG